MDNLHMEYTLVCEEDRFSAVRKTLLDRSESHGDVRIVSEAVMPVEDSGYVGIFKLRIDESKEDELLNFFFGIHQEIFMYGGKEVSDGQEEA